MPVLPDPHRKKYPLLAAALNFFVPGLGYAYNGKRNFMAFVLLVGTVAFAALWYYLASQGLSPFADTEAWSPFALFLSTISSYSLPVAVGYDAYYEARALNETNGYDKQAGEQT